MVHQKRLSAPEAWPVERKNQVYTVASHAGPHGGDAVPLVVFVRDVLGYVENAKELRYALDNDGVLVNGEAVSDHRLPVGTFDIVAFPARDEYYRVFPGEGGRLSLVSVEEDAADNKLARIDGITYLKGGDVQLNLHNGANVVVDDDGYSTKDSVVIDLETNDVLERFSFEEGSAVTAVDGRHSGEVGELTEYIVSEGSSPNTVIAELPDGSTFETVEEYIFVIGESVSDLEEQEEGGTQETGSATETEVEDAEEETSAETGEEDENVEADEEEEAEE
ncbi:MAG: 30S ribosomal protein S4e [Halobacteriales archaeon]|nr:30S ribosomal protein S4e [Halobacteriales archaeon]